MTPKTTNFNETIVNEMLVHFMRSIIFRLTYCTVLPLKIHLVRDSGKQGFLTKKSKQFKIVLDWIF